MENNSTDWYIIVNPHAASGKAMSKWVPVERMLYAKHVSYSMAYTGHKRHAEVLAFEAAREGRRNIIAVGGDGSAHEVFNGIMKWCDENGADPSEFTIGVVPIGSGNDWIKSLNLSKNPGIVTQYIASRHSIKEDVVKLTAADSSVSYMVNIGGIGFDSHVCQLVNLQKESGMRGRRIYLNALIRVVKRIKPINIKIIADGTEVFSGACYSVALGNGQYSGSGMRQVPGALFDDGLADYMICPKIPVKTILSNLPKLFNGKVFDIQGIIHGRAKTIEFVPLDGLSGDIFEVDGEIEGRLPMTLTVTDKQINVIGG